MRAAGGKFQLLQPGHFYVVTRSFVDFDGQTHPVGERWLFRSYGFLPYEDGVTLFLEVDGAERVVRLQWRPEQQAGILDNLATYIAAAGGPTPRSS